eukprot:gene2912-17110_t
MGVVACKVPWAEGQHIRCNGRALRSEPGMSKIASAVVEATYPVHEAFEVLSHKGGMVLRRIPRPPITPLHEGHRALTSSPFLFTLPFTPATADPAPSPSVSLVVTAIQDRPFNPFKLVEQKERASTAPTDNGVAAGAMTAGVAPEARWQTVSKLKLSRDKLLEEIDTQWEELDRLASEHRCTAEELERTRRLATNWEAQAQDNLSQLDSLKDCLHESANWTVTADTQPGSMAQAVKKALNELLKEKAKTSDLEVQVRALAGELLRQQHANMALGSSVLPVLSGFEVRLDDMCERARAMKAKQAAIMKPQPAPDTIQKSIAA